MAIGVLAHLEPWQDPNVEKLRGRYPARYLGFVTDRNDPLKTGRVRVSVPAILGEDTGEDSWLNWCLPAGMGLNVPPMGAPVWITFEQGIITHGVYEWGWILGEDAKTSAAPNTAKGETDPTWVKPVTYTAGGLGAPGIAHSLNEDGEPAAMGELSMTHAIGGDTASETPPVYPYSKAYKSESGFILELDDSPGAPRCRIVHPTGTTLLIDVDGSIHFRSVGAQFFESAGDVVFGLKNGATFKCIYDGGTSFACGASGFHVVGHQATILGRVIRSGTDFI